MQLSGNELFTALASGDINSFEMYFKTYYSALCNYAFTFLRDSDESEEVVQNTFVAMWERRGSVTITTSGKSYLYAMVRNACLNYIKHTKVRERYAAEIPISDSYQESVAEKITADELEQKIAESIETLPEQCRLVFKMSRFEEMKYQEIADHLDISIKTVENHMGKALRHMRDQLREYLPMIVLLTCSIASFFSKDTNL